jgi:Coenzyme PQQ synthesis protein D (PqqD)
MPHPKDRYIAAPGVIAQHVADGAVVYSIRDQSYFALNTTGAVVWASLKQDGTEFGAIVAATLAAYPDAPEAELLVDVGDLLDELVGLGLVQHSAAAAA